MLALFLVLWLPACLAVGCLPACQAEKPGRIIPTSVSHTGLPPLVSLFGPDRVTIDFTRALRIQAATAHQPISLTWSYFLSSFKIYIYFVLVADQCADQDYASVQRVELYQVDGDKVRLAGAALAPTEPDWAEEVRKEVDIVGSLYQALQPGQFIRALLPPCQRAHYFIRIQARGSNV